MKLMKIWQNKINTELSDYIELSRDNPFENWEEDQMPEAAAEEELSIACNLWLGDSPADLQEKILYRCDAIANRAIAEGKFESDLCKGAYPFNYGAACRAIEFAKGLQGEELSSPKLKKAEDGFIGWIKDAKKPQWDSQFQCYWLAGVQLALLRRDSERAKELLSHKWGFEWHEEDFELFTLLANLIEQENPRLEKLVDKAEKRFSLIFHPDFKPDVFMQKTFVMFFYLYMTSIVLPVDVPCINFWQQRLRKSHGFN